MLVVFYCIGAYVFIAVSKNYSSMAAGDAEHFKLRLTISALYQKRTATLIFLRFALCQNATLHTLNEMKEAAN